MVLPYRDNHILHLLDPFLSFFPVNIGLNIQAEVKNGTENYRKMDQQRYLFPMIKVQVHLLSREMVTLERYFTFEVSSIWNIKTNSLLQTFFFLIWPPIRYIAKNTNGNLSIIFFGTGNFEILINSHFAYLSCPYIGRSIERPVTEVGRSSLSWFCKFQ